MSWYYCSRKQAMMYTSFRLFKHRNLFYLGHDLNKAKNNQSEAIFRRKKKIPVQLFKVCYGEFADHIFYFRFYKD